MNKIYEVILMHSYRHLNTVFQLVIAIGYGKEYYELFKISHFCVTSWRKERKNVTGHGNDLKLIESYSAPPAITQQFGYHDQAIYNSSKFRSVRPLLTADPHQFFYVFFCDFLRFHHRQQENQVRPTVHQCKSFNGSRFIRFRVSQLY